MFTIQATGTEPLSYQWERKPKKKWGRSGKWLPCPAEWSDDAMLIIPSVQKSNEGSYRCVISNYAGSQTCIPANLSVGKNPTILMCKVIVIIYIYIYILFLHVAESPRIIIQPHGVKNAVQGKGAKFTIQATGTQPLSYHWQWKLTKEESEEWQPCCAEWSDGATLTIPSVQKCNEGSYRCVIGNYAGSLTSKPAKLEVC